MHFIQTSYVWDFRIKFLRKVDDTRYGKKWIQLREFCFFITENKVFEYFILVVIFASSIALVGTTPHKGRHILLLTRTKG